MGTKKSWEYITKTATGVTRSWTNEQVAQFNYFNPNGLYSQWQAMGDTIRDYVDAGLIPSGWHLAYGSLSSYSADGLRKTAMQDGRINSISLGVTLKMLEADINKGYNKLAEFILGE